MRRIRQLAAAVAVAALLVLAGCIGGLANAGSESDAGNRVVQVGATGDVETAPDRATVRVSVVATGDDVRAVRERLAENSSAMREALEAEGYNVTSARYDIDRNRRDRRRSERASERDAAGFVGRHAFVVRVDDPDAAGDAVVTAIENGATQVERVTFGASEETRRNLRERALAEAMENARTEAGVVAESGDLRLTGMATASTVSVDAEPVVRREVAHAAADGAGSPTRIDAGTVTVRAQVYVTYNATAA